MGVSIMRIEQRDAEEIIKRKLAGEKNSVLMAEYDLTYDELRKILDKRGNVGV